MEEPNLMKRPLVLSGKRGLFGFKRDEYDKIF